MPAPADPEGGLPRCPLDPELKSGGERGDATAVGERRLRSFFFFFCRGGRRKREKERDERVDRFLSFFFGCCFSTSSEPAMRFHLPSSEAINVYYARVSQSATREPGKKEERSPQKSISPGVIVAGEKYRRQRQKTIHPYPSLCCTQCASKHAVQLTGDTSLVRRHSTHSSKGGRPLAPPPPGAPQEEQQELGLGIEKRQFLFRALSLSLCLATPSRLVPKQQR